MSITIFFNIKKCFSAFSANITKHIWQPGPLSHSFHHYTAFNPTVYNLPLRSHLLKISRYYISCVITFILRRVQIGSLTKLTHIIITLYQIVYRGYAIRCFRVDFLAVQPHTFRNPVTLPIITYHHFHTMTHPLASDDGYTAEQSYQRLTRQSDKAYLILKRSHLKNIAIGNLAFW